MGLESRLDTFAIWRLMEIENGEDVRMNEVETRKMRHSDRRVKQRKFMSEINSDQLSGGWCHKR